VFLCLKKLNPFSKINLKMITTNNHQESMKPVYIYNKNILDTKYQLVAQQCHCVAAIKKGAGLAKEIAQKFPYADFYSKRIKDSNPGTIKVVGGKGKRWICAMFAQFHPGKNKGSENREKWFKMCLAKISKIKNLHEIAFPYKIGCGLAGGDWNFYRSQIEKFAHVHDNIKVYIVCLEYPIEKIREQPFLDWLCFEIVTKDDIETDWLKKMYDKYHNYLHNAEEENSESSNVQETSNDNWSNISLEDYTINNTPRGWEDFFNVNLENGVIPKISTYLVGESRKTDIYPEIFNVYKMFVLVPPEDIKVLIIGQDPYHGQGEAMGISFSVPDGVTVPPSLKNIYKELENDGFTVKNKKKGNSIKWCEQGVFMLNTSLTVRAHEAGSHLKIWNDNFTINLMKYMNENCEPLVLILWGAFAQNFSKYFCDRHRKIMSPHPSPFSAHKGFFGSKPFSRTNKILANKGRDTIDWNL
jgi:uracil-DNA glycosylase